jgi:hypothetical protein
MKTTINVDPEIIKELSYMVELQKQHGAPYEYETVDELINYILASVADGSRRPGSWEREMLNMMGLTVDCPEHECYRQAYGKP